MNFRGKGDFRTNPIFADHYAHGEILSPQKMDSAPFNRPILFFEESIEIENYIKSIK
jgi:hypothetical protein